MSDLHRNLLCFLCTCLLLLDDVKSKLTWDPKGYVIYCPCMGRFGNQAEHFIGALAFAKNLDRTLVLPPWRSYKNVPFDEWFQVAPLQEYHRVVLADDFMSDLAPEFWPPGRRQGWCWLPPGNTDQKCAMKEGNPFGPFWDGLNVDFDDYVVYNLGYDYSQEWKDKYPPDKYPVMAFKGAPASFPAKEKHIHLQQYLLWSDNIRAEALDFINNNFKGETFVGLHMRNGIDWENACKHAEGMNHFMASDQCLGYDRKGIVTSKLCFPPKEEILRLTREVVESSKASAVFIATDKTSMKKELEKHLEDLKVRVFHLDPWLPQIDLAILGMSDHFIGNCVSSFTAFVTRSRKVENKPTYFWGHS